MRPMSELSVGEAPTESLVPYANNAKLHSELQVGQIANSIEEFGFNDPVGVWENPKGELEIVEGHGRVLAAGRLGIASVPIVRLDHLTDEQRRAYAHVHNQTTLNSGFDEGILESELDELDFDWDSFGFDVDMDGDEEEKGNLDEAFGYVPFSVLHTTDGKWADRKRQWIGTGIRSELGRGGGWRPKAIQWDGFYDTRRAADGR